MSRRRRRTRFIFDSSKGRVSVMAYSEERARETARLAGYRNLIRVNATERKFVPPSEAKWSKNERNIREAIERLGICWPVEIKQTGAVGGRMGAWRLAPTKYVHRITVKNWLDPEIAGQTIWHELTHAMQAERFAAKNGRPVNRNDFVRAFAASSELRGTYRIRPIEVEARGNECNNAFLPLAK